MKYIRTKDGIFEILRIAAGCIGYMNTNKRVDQWTEQRITLKDETPDYKTADTIEELCDEFVVIESRTGLVVSIERITQFRSNRWKQQGYFVIKGAIWTDKGLIYVAKMNEKGELELL